ncbi:MAG: phosphotransferase [Anaerolineales bacterium]|nr:phosphotransferase [Anaerolineales bacterium]
MKPYSTLTERGQARRLRLLALEALKQYDLDVSRLRLITNSFNGIFRLDTRAGQKVILRVTLPEGGHDRDHVAAEMDWLAALSRDTTLSVPRPIPARNGSLVVEASTDGVPEPRLCAIFSWVPGSDLARHLSPLSMAKLGELMAGLHEHARAYQPPAGLALLRFERVFPFPEPVILFEERFSALFPPERRAVYEQAIAWAQSAIDRLQASGEAMRIIHGDLHQWNVRYYRGVLSPIDFEDLMWGWPVQDIATTLYYFLDPPSYPAMREAFQQGYTRICPWPERYPGEMDAFIAARGLGMVNFVLQDPNPRWYAQAAEFAERTEKNLRTLMGDDLDSMNFTMTKGVKEL